MHCFEQHHFRPSGLCIWEWNVLSLRIHFFFLPNIGLDLPKGIGMWVLPGKVRMYSDWAAVSVLCPGHALLSPSLSWLGWGLRSPDKKSVPSGLVSVSYHGDHWAFFFFFPFWGFAFPNWHLRMCRSTVNRSLWSLYKPPNLPTSLKFFFSHPSCTPKFYLCPSAALSEREELPLARPSPCFNDNPTAQGTMSHRISTANLQVAL